MKKWYRYIIQLLGNSLGKYAGVEWQTKIWKSSQLFFTKLIEDPVIETGNSHQFVFVCKISLQHTVFHIVCMCGRSIEEERENCCHARWISRINPHVLIVHYCLQLKTERQRNLVQGKQQFTSCWHFLEKWIVWQMDSMSFQCSRARATSITLAQLIHMTVAETELKLDKNWD